MNKNYNYYLDELYDYLKYVVMMDEDMIDGIIADKTQSERYYKDYTEYTKTMFGGVFENRQITVTDCKIMNPITYTNLNQLCRALHLPKVAVSESLVTGRPFQGLSFFYPHTVKSGVRALLQAIESGEVEDNVQKNTELICSLMKNDSLLFSKVWFGRKVTDITAYIQKQYSNEVGDMDKVDLKEAVYALLEQVEEFLKYDKNN